MASSPSAVWWSKDTVTVVTGANKGIGYEIVRQLAKHGLTVDVAVESMLKPAVWWSKDTVAVVTGANKGIGYQIVRQLAKHGLTVVLTARDHARGQAAVNALKAEGFQSVSFQPLEVTSLESVEELKTWLKKEYGGIDILVNNAGVWNKEDAEYVLGINYYGVKNVTKGLLPLLRASPAGARIVNVSSRLGLYERLVGTNLKETLRNEDNYSEELADSLAAKYLEDAKAGRRDEEGWTPTNKSPNYSESKIFLNVYAAALAKSLSRSQPEDHQIFVLTFCPGTTVTDMLTYGSTRGFKNPEGAPIKTAEEGADTGVWLALLPKEELVEKHGKNFGERQEYPLNLYIEFP